MSDKRGEGERKLITPAEIEDGDYSKDDVADLYYRLMGARQSLIDCEVYGLRLLRHSTNETKETLYKISNDISKLVGQGLTKSTGTHKEGCEEVALIGGAYYCKCGLVN